MNEKRIRVLLADDTLIAREGWKRILETANNIDVVGEALSAQETPRKVLELKPDVLLMDLKWFGDETAGWIAIREIKTSHPEVKVIAITAYENLIRDARIAGADAALTKTFSREELISLIREVVIRPGNLNNPILPLQKEGLDIDALTPREYEVLKLIAIGDKDREIAEALKVALPTVKNHVRNILNKLGAKNRTEAIAIARQRGLLH